MSKPTLTVFVGTDPRQPYGAETFIYSLSQVCKSENLEVIPVLLEEEPLKAQGLLPPAWDKDQLSPHGRARFLAPYLSKFEGWSLFVDGADMLLCEDLVELWTLRDDRYSVMVVQHPDFHQDFTILGRNHSPFPEFNWSSFMLFNNDQCQQLTAEYVYDAPYVGLQSFRWLSRDLVGNLPSRWNHLVGFYPQEDNPALIHWTKGAPHLGGEYLKAEYADRWFDAAAEMMNLNSEQVRDLIQVKSISRA